MGSVIPGFFEGSPWHALGEALGSAVASGQTVSVGNVVKIAGPGLIAPVSAATDFPIGVAVTSGQLNVDVLFVPKGVVNVISDNAVTSGDFLIASAVTAGQVHDNGSTAPSYGARFIALTSGSAGSPVLALLL